LPNDRAAAARGHQADHRREQGRVVGKAEHRQHVGHEIVGKDEIGERRE
jgi:hypothetical protein